MKAICVDDESLGLQSIVSCCQAHALLDDVKGFVDPLEALDWLKIHTVDLAVLDIAMPAMDGITLAGKIRKRFPLLPVIFVTAHSRYALDSFRVHPTGYLLKPLDPARLTAEIQYALSNPALRNLPRIQAQTFGHFEFFVNGETLAFRRSKSKELLAYLIDRRGAGVTRKEAFAALWEDREYDVSMQKQMDVVIRSLRDTLRKYGADDIFELKNRTMRIIPELIQCDLFRFLDGDFKAINAYLGEYMAQYAWSSAKEGELLKIKNK